MNRARPEKEDAHIGGWKALPCNSGLSDGDIRARLAAGWEPETPEEYIAVVRYVLVWLISIAFYQASRVHYSLHTDVAMPPFVQLPSQRHSRCHGNRVYRPANLR
jgi:hypothetical protein